MGHRIVVLGAGTGGTLAANRARGGSADGRGEDILAERFARGEIDETEYRRRREGIHL